MAKNLLLLFFIGFTISCCNLIMGGRMGASVSGSYNSSDTVTNIDRREVYYKTVFSPNEFCYNSVDEEGHGYIDETLSNREYARVRIPIHLVTDNGVILVACQVYFYKNNQPYSWIYLARSVDNGETWNKQRFLKGGNPNFVYDRLHNRIFSMQGNRYRYSDDDGFSWSNDVVFNLERKKEWDHFYQSPTVGIQLNNGILATVYEAFVGEGKDIISNVNVIVYSRDYGVTWETSPSTPKKIIANESTIAEYAPNQIMINARGGTEAAWTVINPGRRVFVPTITSSSDINKWSITGWKKHMSDKQLIEPICNASFITIEKNGERIGLFSNPLTRNNPRRNITLQYTKDFKTWTPIKLLTDADRHVYGYSSLCYNNQRLTFVYDDRENGILFTDLTDYVSEYLK